MQEVVKRRARSRADHRSMGKTLRIGLTALGVTALTLTGCATARPLSVLPSSTWSAAVTADRAGRDFVSALRHGGVAEESLAALIDDGTTLGLELTATREPSLMPSRDDAAPQPTLVPALAGAAAAAALPTAALAATLADGNATTVRAPHVSVDGRIGSGRADVSLASADLDAVIAATSKQNLCPAGGRVRGVFRTDVAVDGASFTRAAAFSAVAADDRILSMTLTLHTEVELHDADSTGSVTVAGTAVGSSMRRPACTASARA